MFYAVLGEINRNFMGLFLNQVRRKGSFGSVFIAPGYGVGTCTMPSGGVCMRVIGFFSVGQFRFLGRFI